MNRTDQPSSGHTGFQRSREAFEPRAHASALHPLAMRWLPTDDLPHVINPAAEAASVRLRWHRPHPMPGAIPIYSFEGGRDAR